MTDYQELWSQTLASLSKKFSKDTFDEVFGQCKEVAKFENGLLYIVVPNVLIQTKMQTVYKFAINDALKTLTNELVKCKFVLANEVKKTEVMQKVEENYKKYENNLNEHYNFDSYVVGKSNIVAYGIAKKVAENPGEKNPLYIFGGVGLGKTHLMQAIGNYILEQDLTKKILYIPADTFTDMYTKAAMNGQMSEFERKFENLDVLLIDDIQMFAQKPKTQEQFFKLFNLMYDNKKQIVLTSDRPAEQLKNIMDRLTSRFSWGTFIDVKPNTLEDRIKILERKALETTQVAIPNEVFEYIASNFTSNVRQLEGALSRVLLYCEISGCDVSLQLAKDALEANLKEEAQSNSNENYSNLIKIVADFYNITVDDILSSSRNSKFVLPRQIVMYLLKTKYNMPYKKIGSILGGRDHTTILSGCEKINTELTKNNELKLAIDAITKKI